MTLADIEARGVVGAGGAGFPAHVKLQGKPGTIIVNAAECEPLLHKDMEVILHHSREVLRGLDAVMEITGAADAIIGIKEKHAAEIAILASSVKPNTRVVPIEDVYPAGDEITLIYMTTGRVVLPGALPQSVGCVVHNVETLYNIGAGTPVVEKFIGVAGAVAEPVTVRVPVGISYAEVLSHFRITAPQYVVRSGGLMMGALEEDLTTVVSKRTGALIVLPADHYCVTMYRRFRTDHDTDRIAKAGCDQCTLCTEFCPRYLLGQPVRPETAMRNRMFTREDQPMLFPGNLSCCECNLCTMYACPEGLDPRGATVIEKRLAREQNLRWTGSGVTVHPMYEYRKVPTQKLKQRLDVLQFADEGPMRGIEFNPPSVRVPLKEHAGAPAQPVVKKGQTVKKYELIAKAGGSVSSNVHASIDGTVTEIAPDAVHIRRG
ncbi:MAG TPA: 4Fe-4S dicluster domain-containing protein [Bacteroidota bacterium]|nr:4Fe-4S dicluster domain-containing protein [Bacteroidota bacterium]